MKKITLIIASVLLVTSSVVGLAGPKSKGASEFSPGDQMRDQTTKTTKGASDFSPGDLKNDAGAKDAKKFAPGQKNK